MILYAVLSNDGFVSSYELYFVRADIPLVELSQRVKENGHVIEMVFTSAPVASRNEFQSFEEYWEDTKVDRGIYPDSVPIPEGDQ